MPLVRLYSICSFSFLIIWWICLSLRLLSIMAWWGSDYRSAGLRMLRVFDRRRLGIIGMDLVLDRVADWLSSTVSSQIVASVMSWLVAFLKSDFFDFFDFYDFLDALDFWDLVPLESQVLWDAFSEKLSRVDRRRLLRRAFGDSEVSVGINSYEKLLWRTSCSFFWYRANPSTPLLLSLMKFLRPKSIRK